MNHLMLKKLKTENLGNFGRQKVMSVGHLPLSVHRASMGMLVEIHGDFFSKTKSSVIMSSINLGLPLVI